MLKISGRWLAPAKVENCLLQHAAVGEVAVVPLKNADGLVKPIAFVVADRLGSALATELQEFVRAHLEYFKCPREIAFLEDLPRTHLNKVDRNALGRWIARDKGRPQQLVPGGCSRRVTREQAPPLRAITR